MNEALSHPIEFLAAVLIVLYFVLVVVRSGLRPELLEVIALILTSSGIVSAIDLGILAIGDGALLGEQLRDKNTLILIGAVAIMWVSVVQTAQIMLHHYHSIKRSKFGRGHGRGMHGEIRDN